MPSSLRFITTFGLGHMRPASGTWGSLPPPAIGAALVLMGLHPGADQTGAIVFNAAMALILIIFSIACIVQGDAAEARWGHDPAETVADETAGQCLPLLALPAGVFYTWPRAFLFLGFAFITFRILDIIKPWPAHRLQRVPGGWGILLDDLAAGLYAAGVVQLVARVGFGW